MKYREDKVQRDKSDYMYVGILWAKDGLCHTFEHRYVEVDPGSTGDQTLFHTNKCMSWAAGLLAYCILDNAIVLREPLHSRSLAA